MSKKTQFYTSLVLATAGIVLMMVDKFTASANELTSYAGNFTIVTIIGLILMMIAAIWFYYLSFK